MVFSGLIRCRSGPYLCISTCYRLERESFVVKRSHMCLLLFFFVSYIESNVHNVQLSSFRKRVTS